MARARNNSAGFTLIEVMVATSLMALLMTILFMGFRITANAWRRGETKINAHARALSGYDAIRGQLSAAVPVTVMTTGSDQKQLQLVGFSGSSTEVRFVTSQSWRGNRLRPRFMADYRVVQTDAGQQLVISETGLTDDNSILAALTLPLDPSLPAANVDDPAQNIGFEYYAPQTMQAAATWVTQWVPQPGSELPAAVRIRWTRGKDVALATFLIPIHHDPAVLP